MKRFIKHESVVICLLFATWALFSKSDLMSQREWIDPDIVMAALVWASVLG